MDSKKQQELQALDQTLQTIMMQKQSFNMDLKETESALRELGKSGDEVFKIVGQLMVGANKKELQQELEERKKGVESRLKALESQEKETANKLEKLRSEIFGE